jgi:hypothetical protein
MKNLIEFEQLNEAIALPSQPKDAYNKVLAVCKKDPKRCLQVVDTYKASTKEQNTDKNMYSIFVKSVMDKQPLGPAEYMGKRFLLNKDLLKFILSDGKGINENKSINESFWTSIFGEPSVEDAAKDSLKSQGYSHRGRDEDNYIMYDGQKFYPDQIQYDDYSSTKPIPRIENGKLIVANPAWSM